jgi:cell division protein FtsL
MRVSGIARAAEVHYRLNVLLVPVLVVCALLLVDSQHRARKLFIELERMQTRSRELDIQFKQLQLDQLRLAKASMIDQRARRDLGMGSASADRTMYLTMPPVASRWQNPPLALATEAGAGAAAATEAAHAGHPANPANPANLANPANPAKLAQPVVSENAAVSENSVNAANAAVPENAANAANAAKPANPVKAASTISPAGVAAPGPAP